MRLDYISDFINSLWHYIKMIQNYLALYPKSATTPKWWMKACIWQNYQWPMGNKKLKTVYNAHELDGDLKSYY